MQGDAAQHVLGWLFFRHEKWSWPLGSVHSFPYPVGTAVGYTDSIPWVAILAKAASPFLATDFQYIGLWLGLCFFLQGWFGVRIVQELSPNPLIQILGCACYIMDPVLLWRIGHDSPLCPLVDPWAHLASLAIVAGGTDTVPGALNHVGFLYDQRWRPSISRHDGGGTRACIGM